MWYFIRMLLNSELSTDAWHHEKIIYYSFLCGILKLKVLLIRPDIKWKGMWKIRNEIMKTYFSQLEIFSGGVNHNKFCNTTESSLVGKYEVYCATTLLDSSNFGNNARVATGNQCF